MILEKLTVKGIGPFVDEFSIGMEELDDIVAISGRNGVGKTFLLECVPGAIYGYFPFRMYKQAESIYDMAIESAEKGEKSYLEIVFSIGGRRFRISRGIEIKGKVVDGEFKETGKNHTVFVEEWKDDEWVVMAEKAKAAEEFVEREICPKQLFLASCFNSQNSAGDIVDCGADERKMVFSKIIGLGHLQEKADLFNGRSAVVDSIIKKMEFYLNADRDNVVDEELLEGKRNRANDDLNIAANGIKEVEQSIEGLIQKKAENEGDIKKVLKIKEEISEIRSLFEIKKDKVDRLKSVIKTKDELNRKKASLNELKSQLEEKEKEISGISDVREKIQSLKDRGRDIVENRAKKENLIKSEISEIEKEVGELKRDRDRKSVLLKEAMRRVEDAAILKDLDCPANCQFVSNAREAEEWLKNNPVEKVKSDVEQAKSEVDRKEALLKEKRDYLNNREWDGESSKILESIKEEKMVFEKEAEKRSKLEKDCDGLKKRIKEVENADLESGLARVEAAEREIGESELEMGKLKDSLDRKQGELNSIDVSDIDKVDIKIGNLKSERDRLNKVIQESNRILAVCDEAKKKNAELRVEIDKKEKALVEKKRLRDGYGLLNRAFGRNGIQALVIDSEKEQFIGIARELFSILSGGRMSLNFDTQRELKGGGKKESFDLVLTIDGRKRRLEQCSKGQQDLGRMVMRAALGIYHSIKTGARVQTYFLDETTGSLDEVNREGYFYFLKHLLKYFSQIFVISHQDITGSIPCQILITDEHRIEVG